MIKAGSWWTVSTSDLPAGLTAVPGNAPRIIGGQAYLHYSISPGVDMTIDEYMNLLDQIPWGLVP